MSKRRCKRCGGPTDVLFSHVSCANRCDWKGPPPTPPKPEKAPHDCPTCGSADTAPFSMWAGAFRHCLDCGKVFQP